MTALAPIARDTHRGWLLSHRLQPVPFRDFDWSATHPDFDGAEDAGDDRHVTGPTREAVCAAVDDWIEDNEQ